MLWKAASQDSAGGGGAGGVFYSSSYAVTPSAGIDVTIVAGGAGSTIVSARGVNGFDSAFGNQTAVGGGGGGSDSPAVRTGAPGGSGVVVIKY